MITNRPGGVVLAAAALAALLAACGSEPSDRSEAPPDQVSLVDWTGREALLHDDRWTVAFCEGEAPILCLTDDSGNRGGVELSTWDAAESEVIEEAWEAGGDDAAALRALAEDHAAVFVADRAEGCGPEYEVVPDQVVSLDVGGHPGIRFGFRGVRDGATLEHSLGHAVIVDGLLHLITTSALAEDGCLAREGEFDIATFDAATIDLLDDIATASVLPTTCSTCPPGGDRPETNDA